jgi:hypothetical protein
MGFLKQLARSLRPRQSVVEEHDLHMLYLVLEWRAETKTPSRARTAPREDPSITAERLSASAALLSLSELRNVVKRHVERQVHSIVGDRSGVAFKLDVRPSSIPSAGRGVFAARSAVPGQVVALMPGLVYPKQHHRDIPGYPSFGNESMLMMSRHDGHVIDSRAFERFNISDESMREYNAARRKRDGQYGVDSLWFHQGLREHPSPLALGHIINHPPSGTSPNVLPAPVDWRDSDVSRIPWSLYKVPGMEAVPAVVPGIAFVATRSIEHGEELFVNYRLNPGVVGGLPTWYEAVDSEEDALRWL